MIQRTEEPVRAPATVVVPVVAAGFERMATEIVPPVLVTSLLKPVIDAVPPDDSHATLAMIALPAVVPLPNVAAGVVLAPVAIVD
jgi:hypothetical protein